MRHRPKSKRQFKEKEDEAKDELTKEKWELLR
jgi:hypothetical protein